jgi:hypothetical protein
MNNACLTTVVILVTTADGVQHYQSGAEVEWYIVAQSSARSRGHHASESALLDVQVTNVRITQPSRDALCVAPKATFT